ncbi:hypothetical protein RT717_13300 [Imperialibacter roseus]|uniref:SH3 domain-containing protein n=1 Tax=Imperialibacter roseus TaxID=1324217 RepID=A0ABZ0IXU7_9BACT|nr:hypothetical protein [Imperialibacter roseus]WOK09616.1 hypothetical protein RT717_13300 [Imperialibacter roseus]
MIRILLILLCFGPIHLVFSQEGIKPSLGRLQGLWEGSYNEQVFGYLLVHDNQCLSIISGETEDDVSVFSRPFGYLGFWDDMGGQKPEKVSDLTNEGRKLLFFEFEGFSFDSEENLAKPTRSCFITMNENEPSSDSIPRYFHLSCRGQPDIYSKIKYLPLSVLNGLRKNDVDWEKYEKFLSKIDSFSVRVVSEKAYIFSEPEVATKMYLIKNDEAELLEERNGWILVRYFGKKIIDGWVKKSDLITIQ